VAAGSVLERLEKKPNRDVLLGLGAGAGVGSVEDRCFSGCRSGVGPRVGRREVGAKLEVTLGLGDGLREDCLGDMIPNPVLLFVAMLAVEPVDVVRWCENGKLFMLL
jgi:hypothetical protein